MQWNIPRIVIAATQSGGGKTTLALAIMRLIESEGPILFMGRDIGRLSGRQMRGRQHWKTGRLPRRVAALERRDALLQHGDRRVGDAAVAEPLLLQVEEGGAVVGAVEGVGHRLVDRHRDGVRRGVVLVAGMDGDGLAAHGSVPFRGAWGARACDGASAEPHLCGTGAADPVKNVGKRVLTSERR